MFFFGGFDMNKIFSSVMVRDLKVGMIIEGSGEITSIGYHNGFVIKTERDSITIDGNQRFDIAIIVPDDFIRFDDEIFKSCGRIKADDCILDQNTGSWTMNVPDGYYQIDGFFGSPIFDNWPGVGPSKVGYSMKCYIENNQIYRPGGREFQIFGINEQTGSYQSWNKKVQHKDNWYSIGK